MGGWLVEVMLRSDRRYSIKGLGFDNGDFPEI